MLQQLTQACESEPTTSGHPYPTGPRDTRLASDEWARDLGMGGNLPAGAEAAMQEQAEVNAQATLVDAYKAAMADVATRWPGWFAHGLYSMPFGTYGKACWQVIVSKGGEQYSGTGPTIAAAVEDLAAQAAVAA